MRKHFSLIHEKSGMRTLGGSLLMMPDFQDNKVEDT